MPKLRWLEHRQDGEKIMWTANRGDYKCTITPPNPDVPFPIYHWEVRCGSWEQQGGGPSLDGCQTSVRLAIEKRNSTAKVIMNAKTGKPVTRQDVGLD